jgi:three-Cys-motif partner protein
VTDPYVGREQTKAKHFILRRYLQALAFKVLRFSDITYVDGFSGPWETQTEDFADSSFMIAIAVLRDAQQRVQQQTGKRPKVRCFLVENDPKAYAQLSLAVTPFNKQQDDFEIRTHCSDFEDTISAIQQFIGRSFPLIFIDPKGWTGFAFDKIRPLFDRAKCEVAINFMYDFANPAASMRDPKTIASLDPILGGPGWEQRLDPGLPRGLAVEKLFRDTLRNAGGFSYVVSTKIDRSTADRIHFFLAYGTKSEDGLRAFRETEYSALRVHTRDRADTKERKREAKTGSQDLFAGMDADRQELSFEDLIEEQKAKASEELLAELKKSGPMKFSRVWSLLLVPYMLRVTNVKDICVKLAANGAIRNSWGGRNRKPQDDDLIELIRYVT